jgi:hypothetical protein
MLGPGLGLDINNTEFGVRKIVLLAKLLNQRG